MPVRKSRGRKYPKPFAVLRTKQEKGGPLTVQNCKDLIGWTEEPPDTDWGKEFVLKDVFGKKIRLAKNPSNRPFKRPLANRYANEHIRDKWSVNLETVVVSDTDHVLQGQHRLVGLILADQLRQIDSKQWGKTPLVYETLIGYGASSTPKNADTYDLGAKRTLSDVLYRRQKFGKGVSDKKQRGVSKILSGAVRLVWLRVGGKLVSFAPHFPHSEALEFYGQHPEILTAVTTIVQLDDGEEGNEKCISSLISLSYAAGLMYLMESAVDSKTAVAFWEAFASGEGLKKGSPILSLRQLLVRMDASSSSKRDQIIGAVIKAWLLFVKNKSGVTKDIRVARKKDGDKFVSSEFPRIGGLDSPVELEVGLTQHQLLVLSALRSSGKESTYKYLTENTGLQIGTLANAIMEETKRGKQNPHSLVSRKLVAVSQYEPQEGETTAPYNFQITVKGKSI